MLKKEKLLKNLMIIVIVLILGAIIIPIAMDYYNNELSQKDKNDIVMVNENTNNMVKSNQSEDNNMVVEDVQSDNTTVVIEEK